MRAIITVRYFVPMKKICLWLLLVGFTLSLSAQELSDFEKMRVTFNSAASDTAKLRILFEAKPMKYMNDPDALLALYQQGYLLAKRQNDKVNRFKAVHYIALTYMYGKLDENTAYQWLQKALAEAEAAKNNRYIGWVYYAIGIIHDHQGEREEMYRAFYCSVDYLEKADEFYSGTFIALAQNLEVDQKWEEQLAVIKRLIALLERMPAPVVEKLTSYNNMVDVLKHFPERKREIAYYRTKTMEFLHRIPVSNLYSDDILIIASIYHKYNRFDLAVKYAGQVADMPDTAGYNLPNKGLAHKFLSELYEERQQYDRSLYHFKQYQLIEADQITQRMNDDAGKKIIKAQAERDIAIKQKEIDRQQVFTYFVIAIACLVIAGIGLIYRFYRREKAQKAELSTLNATKDKLFAILSHDLRSPVASLENSVMLSDWGALSREEFTESTQSLGRKIGQVRTMLDNLLQWSLTQMGGLRANVEPTAAAPIVEEECAMMASMLKTKNIRLINEIEPDTVVLVDRHHLSVIVRNLLQNAVKFTHSGGSVTIQSEKHREYVRLTVADTGIGIAVQQLENLFSLNKSTSRRGTAHEQGTGLGLVLVKELAEANGAKVQATGREEGGTVFCVDFKAVL